MQTAAEPGGVGRKLSNTSARRRAGVAAGWVMSGPSRRSRGDRQRVLGAEVESAPAGLRLAEPEHLRQAHRLVVAGVVEHAEDPE